MEFGGRSDQVRGERIALVSVLLSLLCALLGRAVLFSSRCARAEPEPLRDGGLPVLVLRGYGDRGPFQQAISSALSRAGVEHAVQEESKLAQEAGGLDQRRVVIVSYGAQMKPDTEALLLDFVEKGGILCAFYRVPPRLASALGVRLGRFIPDDHEQRFHSIAFQKAESLPGLPARVVQDSWNIFETTSDGAACIGRWEDSRGQPSGFDAVFLSEHGTFTNHVLTAHDVSGKARFLAALLGHFDGGVWTGANRVLEARATAAAREIDAVAAGDPTRAADCQERANQARQSAVECAATDPAKAHSLWMEALRQLELVRCSPYRSKSVEMRGVFVPQPYVAPSWEAVMSRLEEGGLNAAFVYAGSLGRVFYRSQLLPMEARVQLGEDPVGDCLKAGREHGIAVHLWFNALNVNDAPPRVLEELRTQRRIITGVEPGAQQMACPSEPQNRKLVVDSVVELARCSRPAGIMLDYFRYPFAAGQEFCYCPHCERKFVEETKLPQDGWPKSVQPGGEHYDAFRQWRCDNLTALLAAIRSALAELTEQQPVPLLSVATFGWPDARNKVGQDASAWIGGRLVDSHLCLNFTPSVSYFKTLVENQVREAGNEIPTYCGIGAFSHAAQFEGPLQLVDQIEVSRQAEAHGFVVFRLNTTFLDEFLPALKMGVTSGRASVPHVQAGGDKGK